MDILAALNRRYATKKFLPNRKISDEDLHILLESIRLAPSSYGLQPFRVTVIRDQATKDCLRNYSWDQAQISDSSDLIVFSIIKDLPKSYFSDFLDLVCSVRAIPKEALKLYQDILESNLWEQQKTVWLDNWSKQQVYIALGFLLFAAAQLEIDTCPMEWFNKDEYDRILGLSQKNQSAVVVCAIWYRNPEDPNAHFRKIRRSSNELFSYFPMSEE